MSENPGTTPPPPPSEPPPASPPPPPPAGPPPAGPPREPGSNKTLMLVLSYLGPLALIPFLTEKDDPEVQWHAKHGLVLLAAEVVVWIAISLVLVILPDGCFIGGIGCVVWLALWIAILVVHVLCIVKATKGERFLVPGISQYADRF